MPVPLAAPALELAQNDGGAAPASLADVYRRHAQDVARWARRLGGPLVDVEDVVQEVFVVAHRRLHEFRGDAAVTTWLFRITHNVARHRRRKERYRQWLRGSAEETAGSEAAPGPDAVDRLHAEERSRQLYRVLDGMSEKYRTVLILFELEELSGEEIARMMDAKVGTVWVWLHRARADFLKRMQALEEREGA